MLAKSAKAYMSGRDKLLGMRGHGYVLVVPIDCTKDNLGCPGCLELLLV